METQGALHSNQDECDRSSEKKHNHMYFRSSTLCKQTPFLKSIDVSIVLLLGFYNLAALFLLISSHTPPTSQKFFFSSTEFPLVSGMHHLCTSFQHMQVFPIPLSASPHPKSLALTNSINFSGPSMDKRLLENRE